MSKVVVLQSNYLPWKGYFHLIQMADKFVFYDDVQFTKNDWRNRNQIKSARGPVWLSIPTGQKIHRKICEVELADSAWQQKHWKIIVEAYSRTPFFELYAGFFEEFYLNQKWTNLSVLNHYLTKHIARNFLKIETLFDDSRNYNLENLTRGERLYSLLEQVEAKEYISGPSGKNYLDEAWFKGKGIKLSYIDYSRYKEYPQISPPFTHQVSILDLLFQAGDDAGLWIWGS